jgi:hypothetical protein
VGDRRHRAFTDAGPARLLLLPVVVAGAWTVVGLALGPAAAFADGADSGASAAGTAPLASALHALPGGSVATRPAVSPSPSPSPSSAVPAVHPLPSALSSVGHVASKAVPVHRAEPPQVRPKLREPVRKPIAVAVRPIARQATTVVTATGDSIAGAVKRVVADPLPTATVHVVGVVKQVVTKAAGTADAVAAPVLRSVPTGILPTKLLPTKLLPTKIVPTIADAVLPVDGGGLLPRTVDRPAVPHAAVPDAAPSPHLSPTTPRPALPSPAPTVARNGVPSHGAAPTPRRAASATVPDSERAAQLAASRAAVTSVVGVPGPLTAPGAPAPLPAAPTADGTGGVTASGSRGGHPLPLIALPDGAALAALASATQGASATTADLPIPASSFDVAPD